MTPHSLLHFTRRKALRQNQFEQPKGNSLVHELSITFVAVKDYAHTN